MERPKIGQGNWIYLGALAAIAGLAALAYYAVQDYQRRQSPPPASAANAAPDPVQTTYTGKIRARKSVLVPAPIDGTVEELTVTDGEEVFEGQVLGKIQNTAMETAKQSAAEELEKLKSKLTDLESQLIAARLESSRAAAEAVRVRSELETASRNFERQKLLFREGAGAKKSYDKAEADFASLAEENKRLENSLRVAEARASAVQKFVDEARAKATDATEEAEQAEAELLTGEIKAPVSGLLVSHKKDNGDEVTRDIADLFEIAIDLTDLEVVVDVPAALTGKIAAGSNALVQIAEAGPTPLAAKVREVKEGQAFVEFLSPSPSIRPSMTAQVRFLVN